MRGPRIQGQYDFELVFSPETLRGVQGGGRVALAPGEGRPADAASHRAGSIYDSVHRYGLKLEPRKAPMEILLVDHLEQKPTGN